MNKITFDTLPEAKEYVAFAKSHGYEISDPVKVKRPKTARKMYDLNGKPVKFQWTVVMGIRGKGKRGGKDTEKKGEKDERDYGTCKSCWKERASLGESGECRTCEEDKK